MKRIKTSELVPGMITQKDVYSYGNQLIIAANTVITDSIITKLKFHTISSIFIKDEDEDSPDPSLEICTHSQKIRHSRLFYEFNQVFFDSSKHLKSTLDDAALLDKEIDISLLLDDIDAMVEKTLYTFNMFDMLHNMRQYDDQTYVHSLNVGLICNTFGQWLGWNKEDVDVLTLCGLLHDIGKIFIPANVIRKPTALTASEFELVKAHTTDGYYKLKNSSLNEHILNSVMQHHERCDGTGYTMGLKSDDIDPFAKIVAIADVYDAMTCARIYRDPMCPFHVIEIFEREGLTKYEPAYLLQLLENIALTYIHNQVLLDDEKIGTVVMINKSHLSRPVLQIGDEFIDLAINPSIKIKSFI